MESQPQDVTTSLVHVLILFHVYFLLSFTKIFHLFLSISKPKLHQQYKQHTFRLQAASAILNIFDSII
ncbi:unnamed protein product [Acanthoscelides obtectus]|uniref:Uncharacterized protein n=1 Tax=Acanthoscelides obtectus TaxID=200917 RepID=A0A9P0VPU6_ACAOB|nr:unnamed protein product [Acanthoscelides obtectus]CAK1667896.1 hypothetical protein AOBTE_LOCUS26096 [Acanthoscelides obtectus]